jgi:hypothetical protein
MAIDKVNQSNVGAIAQAMKFQVRTGAGWDDLSPTARESIDQILSSIARTVSSGQGVHWDGIMAYADAAKPGTADPVPVPMASVLARTTAIYPPTPARSAGMEAIERSMRELPHRDADA